MNKHWKKSFTNEAKCLKSICSRWCAEEHVQRYLIQQRFWIWVIFAEVKRCPKYCGKVQQTLNNVSKYMWVESLSKLVIDHKNNNMDTKGKMQSFLNEHFNSSCGAVCEKMREIREVIHLNLLKISCMQKHKCKSFHLKWIAIHMSAHLQNLK